SFLLHPAPPYISPLSLYRRSSDLVFLATALLASWIAPYDPVAPAPDLVLHAPSWGHPFGTDELGRDVLSRVMYGSRISLEVGAVDRKSTRLNSSHQIISYAVFCLK